ncbi:MAG: twin-arginine translocation signal domain-containing protein [Burkholderiaceae bacterium]
MGISVSISRRRFLQTGAAGAALLAGAGWVYHSWRELELDTLRPLILTRICQAMLKTIIAPDDTPALQSSVQATLSAISTLPPYAQKELDQLFSLLAWQPSGWLLTGIRDWDKAELAQVEKFLTRWRHHDWLLLQSAYHALHDLTLGAWYAQAGSWLGIGYPGPPRW